MKVVLGMEVGLSPGDLVLDGHPVPHFYCAQTAGCIKMSLGMEVCLGPGEFVLDGNAAPRQRGAGPLPSFKG